MTAASPADVHGFIAAQLTEPLLAVGLDPAAMPADLDLLAEGLVDSFGFLELVLALEQHYGVELDLEQLDPDEFTRVDALAAHVAGLPVRA